MKTALQIITTIFLTIYTYGVVMGTIFVLSENNTAGIGFEDIYVLMLYFLLVASFILSWKNELLAGRLYLVWYIATFVLSSYIAKESTGVEIILGLPALAFGPLFILLGLRKGDSGEPDARSEWRYILRYLSTFYLLVYFILFFRGFKGSPELSIMEMPGLLLWIPFVMFLAAYVFTWLKENIAGFIFLVWYLLVLLLAVVYNPIGGNGRVLLFAVFGIAILIQGFFYLNYWYRVKE